MDIMEVQERVYDTLMGNLIPGYRLPWVEEIFVPGHPCYEEYSRALEAYERVCQRLGGKQEDADVEVIINSLLEHGKIIATEMFKYGRLYEKMQHTE